MKTTALQPNNNLRFFNSEKMMTRIEISVLALGLISAVTMTLLILNRGHLPPSFTKLPFIATVSAIGLFGSTMIIGGLYIQCKYKVFRFDPQFFEKYPRLIDFIDKFGWEPFIKDEISVTDYFVAKSYVSHIVQELEAKPLASLFDTYKADTQQKRHLLFSVIDHEPKSLDTFIITTLKEYDLSHARTLLQDHLPPNILQRLGELFPNLVAFCNVTKTKEEWNSFKQNL